MGRLILMVAAMAAATAPAGAAMSAPLERGQVVADLLFFRDQWAPREHAYTEATRAAMLAYIDRQIADARPMERWQLALIFSRAMAFTGNNHTKTRFFDEEGSFHVIPLSFWWFREGAMVTRVHPDHRELLGAQIVSIGGVPVREALARVAPFIPGTADTVRYMSPGWLRRLEVLRAIGLSNGQTARVAFRLADGRRVVRSLAAPPAPAEAGEHPDPAQYSPVWRQSMVPGRGPHPWPHILERLPSLPLYAQPPATFATTELADGRVLYIRSNAISPVPADQRAVEEQSYALVSAAVADGDPPRHVIVDLRFNEGGNFLSILNFARELVEMTAPDGRIYVITGRATNSAAIAFAALLKGQAPERTSFVGEHPSDNAAFWSEGGDLLTPSQIALHYTDGLHDWGNGCRDLRRCYWPVVFHGTAIGNLDPDIPVEMRFADFIAGRDPALAAALSDISVHEQGRRIEDAR